MKNFEIYICWEGYYAGPGIDYNPRIINEVWTELTIYENNLKLVRTFDDDLSDIILRTKLTGDFVLKDNDYDLLQTAISNNFNELILKIKQYNGVTYNEVWRGLCEIRGDMGDNRKTVKLSKFETADDYSDISMSLDYEWTITRTVADSADVRFSALNISGFNPVNLGWEGWMRFRIYSATLSNSYDSKQMSYYRLKDEPSHYNLFGMSDDGVTPRSLSCAEVLMASDLSNSTDGKGFKMTLKKMFQIYKDLFDVHWFLGERYTPDPARTYNNIYLRKRKDFYNATIVHDFTSITGDFKRYKYILPRLLTFEWYKQSEKNVKEDHIDAMFKYSVLGVVKSEQTNDSVFTDFETMYDGYIGGTLDDDVNMDDLFFILLNEQVGGWSEIKTETTQLNVGVWNGELAQSYRMQYYLQNFRQLDEAEYNDATRTLNPDIAGFQIKQEKFPVNDMLITDFDFNGITKTSLGYMRINEVEWKLTDKYTVVECYK